MFFTARCFPLSGQVLAWLYFSSWQAWLCWPRRTVPVTELRLADLLDWGTSRASKTPQVRMPVTLLVESGQERTLYRPPAYKTASKGFRRGSFTPCPIRVRRSSTSLPYLAVHIRP
ncbi:hypothetical protein K432DRAFT_25292 [Lepidopterella palustris CBS 459.81]|uniref:Uncharacterized protein n=1 Tax=Lepidopterella palustris CBS 459.81 TaxID=1314670 RepID=A0A8E2DWR0_9PEZI|nr:hypothetical protein K432DRAFT_25292 [Lepidopterella palustris CBS 459.81]